ncbi:MAG: MoaD/ThiS family protein [Clostridiales bacterium]|nr:MoaD/ThiS family protein [Clostridiales bacterium]
MNVEVRLFATLRLNRFKKDFMEVAEGSTCNDIISIIGIDVNDVAILMINGIHSNLSDFIKDKDIISIFPPVGGG